MRGSVVRIVIAAVAALAIALVAPAGYAITITYDNPGPNDGQVHGGFTNIVQVSQPGFYTTTDFLSHENVIARFDTAIGHGTFPTIESTATAQVEIGTNLNSPTGTGVRSVFAPITNSSFVAARGETYQPGPNGNYSSNAFVHSGDASSTTTPTAWTIFVDPETGEVPGTPVDVTIDASILGNLSAAGSSTADATWTVSTTSFGAVMAGSQSQSVVGSSVISDSGSLTFTILLGSTFELFVHYDLNAAGSGAGANSFSEITSSLVEISAVISGPTPPMFTTAFLEPLGNVTTASEPAGPYKANRTIPVKFELYDENDELVSDAIAAGLDVRIDVFYEAPGAAGTPVDPGDNPGDYGDAFRYLGNGTYIFNLSTKHANWVPDYSYKIVVVVDGNPVGEAYFSLR